MLSTQIKVALLCYVAALVLLPFCPAAGTEVIRLNLGADQAADVRFDGAQLFAIDDADVATIGDQDTGIEYVGFLEGLGDTVTPVASFSLSNTTRSGAAMIQNGTLVMQDFSGGMLELYDSGNALLLSATLADSTLSGNLGSPATATLLTTTFVSATGGLLAPLLDMERLSMSLSLANVNDGNGISVNAMNQLDPFDANATASIGYAVPEPAGILLVLAASYGLGCFSRLC